VLSDLSAAARLYPEQPVFPAFRLAHLPVAHQVLFDLSAAARLYPEQPVFPAFRLAHLPTAHQVLAVPAYRA
jgi:hypothetical protein